MDAHQAVDARVSYPYLAFSRFCGFIIFTAAPWQIEKEGWNGGDCEGTTSDVTLQDRLSLLMKRPLSSRQERVLAGK